MVFLRARREGPGGPPQANAEDSFWLGRHWAFQRVAQTLIPWALLVSVQFASADAAIRFERFLKSSSGRAFAKHYFE